jgi:phosphate transport system substrate-binding protein
MKFLIKSGLFGFMVLSNLLWLTGCGSGDGASVINGAGATFPYPIYSQWAHKYQNMQGVQINYQSIGSGGGIAQIKAKTVDFGASDAPLESEELDNHDLIQFPMVIGGVVPVVNIEGIAPGKIILTAPVLSGIFLGKIKKWDDVAIKSLNPDIALPKKDVTVVHRADGSGTTWIFTNYLDKVSPEWHETVGTGKAVSWPAGVGGKGNEGVANYVKRVDGAIGYVEYAYALQNQMSHVLLKNKDGNSVAPTIETFQAAAANADWEKTPGFSVVLTDQPGVDSWPITGASFILIYKEQPDIKVAKTVLSFFDWCYRHGADMAKELHYVPIPLNVVEIVEQTWRKEIRSKEAVVWK